MALNIASSCQESQAECCNKEGLLLFPSEMSLCKIQPSFSLLQPSSCYMQRGAKFIISGKKMANIFPRPWEKERTDCGSIIQEKTTGDILHEQQLAALPCLDEPGFVSQAWSIAWQRQAFSSFFLDLATTEGSRTNTP